MQWHLVHGTQGSRPAEIEVCEHDVYIRKDIHRTQITDEYGTSNAWEYYEVVIPHEDGKNIVRFSDEIYQAKMLENSKAIDDILVYILEG